MDLIIKIDNINVIQKDKVVIDSLISRENEEKKEEDDGDDEDEELQAIYYYSVIAFSVRILQNHKHEEIMAEMIQF